MSRQAGSTGVAVYARDRRGAPYPSRKFSSRCAVTFDSSIARPRLGASGTVIDPATGCSGSCRKNWWTVFHLIRYSWIGVVVGGWDAIRCAVACELWPWG